MSDIDAEAVARRARLDQYRAGAEDILDKQVDNYRSAVADLGQDSAFAVLVLAIRGTLDPNGQIDDETMDEGLTIVAETLACAISRLSDRS